MASEYSGVQEYNFPRASIERGVYTVLDPGLNRQRCRFEFLEFNNAVKNTTLNVFEDDLFKNKLLFNINNAAGYLFISRLYSIMLNHS